MRKNIRKLCKLSLILLIISTFIILFFGKTYNTVFIVRGDKYEKILENDTGEVEIIDEERIDDRVIIKVKAKKVGKVFLSIKDDEFNETKIFYVHKSMIITDNTFFGKSSGSEVIPISLFIVLIYGLYLLVNKYRQSVKDNLYQYKNIAYLGIIIFLSLFSINIFISIFNYQGLYETINDIIHSSSNISIYLFPIIFITFIFVTISNINLIRKEGLSLRNILGLLLGIFICVSTLLPDSLYSFLLKSQRVNIFNLNGPGPYIYNFVETLIYLVNAYLECILIGTIIIGIKAVRKKIDYNKDYIIILGCKIKKDGTLTPLLKGRVDRAIEFRNKQIDANGKELVFIPSGGKGSDEVISEAEAMKRYLLDKGIKGKNIIIENKSKNTYENIKFSNKLIKKKRANICYSTTNYHVLRAGLIATSLGLKMDGIGGKTKAYFWINAFIREFIGTLYSEKKRHIIVFGIIIVVLIIMIMITYVANTI